MDEAGLMKTLGEIFFNWQVILISFSAFAVLSLVKKMGTRREGDKKDGKIIGGFAQNRWFKVGKPAYPYVLAMGLCFVPGVPLPEKVTISVAVQVMYGIYAGWLSDKSYQFITNFVNKIIKKVS